jgi:cyanoexosortase A
VQPQPIACFQQSFPDNFNMKITYLISLKRVSRSHYWLLGIATALTAIYATLVWQSGDIAHLGMSVLFYLAAGMIFLERQQSLQFRQGWVAKGVGVLAIGILLWQVALLLSNPDFMDNRPDPALRLFPFVSMLGVGLIASGFKGLKRYGQELTILFFLGVPSVAALFLPDFSPATAEFSAFLLQLAGFDAAVRDIYISVSGIETSPVYAGCSGIEGMTYLLGLSVVGLILFPIARIKRIFIPFLAVLIGFTVNGVRVAILSLLEVAHNDEGFTYWHQGDGSLVFGLAAVLIFAICYWLLYQQEAVSETIT